MISAGNFVGEDKMKYGKAILCSNRKTSCFYVAAENKFIDFIRSLNYIGAFLKKSISNLNPLMPEFIYD